jgi:capsule polysaccharide export protein KpsE/RkpR
VKTKKNKLKKYSKNNSSVIIWTIVILIQIKHMNIDKKCLTKIV